jgi:hypothetical protein
MTTMPMPSSLLILQPMVIQLLLLYRLLLLKEASRFSLSNATDTYNVL